MDDRLGVKDVYRKQHRARQRRRRKQLPPVQTQSGARSWPCPYCQGMRGLDCRLCYGAGYYTAQRFAWDFVPPRVLSS